MPLSGSTRVALALLLTLPLCAAAGPHERVVRTGHERGASIQGSGKVVRQTRTITEVRRIVTRGSAEIRVRIGPRPSLVVAAERNLLPYIQTEVRGETLMVAARGPIEARKPIRVFVTMPDLTAFHSLGSGTALIEGIDNEQLKLAILGSGVVRATGRTSELVLMVHGTGRADVERLAASRVQIAIRRSGGAKVRPGPEGSAGSFLFH